ncbi:MAG: sigma-70 family RNA polymerase sigma factor [Deltaproteobacteria bacterium]|jgi:RNA polymerase sigma-70 factor (ECF subfamily)|nr:sigma-70 family RNA polymerase sigma factor [Deltaproteobacteria bacterium]MBW2537657.1 sigma-70 family RNA polymerase sigma factor [Deltaproteobacteria bacterium]
MGERTRGGVPKKPDDGRPSARQVVHALDVLGGDRLDDATLVELMQQGDRRGAALLYDRFAPLVRGIVARTFGPAEDASDLVQEVLIAVVEHIGELRDASSLRGFVYGVALNKVRMELRRRGRRRLVLFGRRPMHEPVDDPGSDEACVAAKRLYELLDELGEQARMFFLLRYVEELPLAEIAVLTNTSVATTKRRIAKATRVVWARARAIPELASYVPDQPAPPQQLVELPPTKEPRHA